MTEGNVNGVTEKEKNKNRVDRVSIEKRMRVSGKRTRTMKLNRQFTTGVDSIANRKRMRTS